MTFLLLTVVLHRDNLNSIFPNAPYFMFNNNHTFETELECLPYNDRKQTWTFIKDTLQNKAREELPNKYLLNDRTLSNMDEIANEFNKYFINIGRLLSEQITFGLSSDEYLNDKTE